VVSGSGFDISGISDMSPTFALGPNGEDIEVLLGGVSDFFSVVGHPFVLLRSEPGDVAYVVEAPRLSSREYTDSG